MAQIIYLFESRIIEDLAELDSDSKVFNLFSKVKNALKPHLDKIAADTGTVTIQYSNGTVWYNMVGVSSTTTDIMDEVMLLVKNMPGN